MLLVGLHVVEGLQHGLHQLSLGGKQLLQVSVVVVVGVAVAGLAIALAVPGVHHLMVWKREKGKTEIPRNPAICTRDVGKMLSFFYLNIDEVVDKVPKHPTTLTNTHKQKHQSSNKR